MKPFSSLVHAHVGRVGVAMGGGLSLPEQVNRAPSGSVLISANEHGAKLGVGIDYIVGVDRHVLDEKHLRAFGVPLIAPHNWADYRIAKQHHPSAGITTAWALWVMGCAPILLAGMDLYRGGTYWHKPDARSTGNTVKLGRHIDRWLALKNACGGVLSPFRAMGGPLLDFFPRYDPSERVTPSHVVAAAKSATGVRVAVERRYATRNADGFEPGDEPELAPEHAERLVRGGYARYLDAPGQLPRSR